MTGTAKQPAKPADQDAEDKVEEASEESFPASDPPAWTPTHAGRPRAPDRKKRDSEDSKPGSGQTGD